MEFEVASVRPDDSAKFKPPLFPLSPDDSYAPTGGRFFADFPLPVYIEFAYKLWLTHEQQQVMLADLPKWVRTQKFVIDARAPEPNPTKDQMRLMLQSLLADRFGLTIKFEKQPAPVFALVLAKRGVTGPNLRPHDEGTPCPLAGPRETKSAQNRDTVFPPICDVFMLRPSADGQRILGSRNATIEMIAESLPSVNDLGRPVMDRTGLAGRYDFTLQWAPETKDSSAPGTGTQSDAQGPTFFEALKDKLGVKLKPTKALIEVPIVSHVQWPSPN